MIFWIVTSLMVAGSVLIVLVPLSRRYDSSDIESEGASFYRSQLQNVDLLISNLDKPDVRLEEERAEIARRLIKEVERESVSGTSQGRSGLSIYVGSLLALIGVPAATLLIYLSIGEPGVPDAPFFAQRALEPSNQRSEQLVARVEEILKKNPDDIRGWEVLANFYQSANQPMQAVRALRNIERVNGQSGPVSSRIGALLTISNRGIVSDEAKILFRQALKHNENDAVAKSHMAIASEQEGNNREALKKWMELKDSAPEESQAYNYADAQIRRLSLGFTDNKQPVFDRDTQTAITSLPAQERSEMIQGMVARLAGRLEEDSGTIEDWARLVRSYVVLKDQAKAKEYLELARSKFESSPEDMEILRVLAVSLNLNGPQKQ